MEEVTAATKEIERGEKDSKKIERTLIESEKLMPQLRTLVYCTNKAMEDGYTQNFKATKEGLSSAENSKLYKPDELKVANFYRFEGITDPADMAVLYLIETNDGAKGTLVDAYGTYSDPWVAKFICAVLDIEKRQS
jgi:hypothetical protein